MSIILISCNSAQSDAQNTADEIQKTMAENSPEAKFVDESGVYMTAKIDGREWSAVTMIPDNNERSTQKRIRGEKGEDNITFQLWKQGIEAGKKVPFSESNPAGIFLENDPALLSGQKGEVEITKLDDEWLEGVFHFTATSPNSSKKVEVTDGRFRVQSGIK